MTQLKQITCYLFLYLSMCSILMSQNSEPQFKVYGFEEGLTHRNVFKIHQDHQGFMWIATSKGLNRFDGHQFLQYLSGKKEHHIPYEFIPDMLIAPDSGLYLSNANTLTILNPQTGGTTSAKPADNGDGWLPGSLYVDSRQELWMMSYINQTGTSVLQKRDQEGEFSTVLTCKGTFSNRAFIEQDGRYYLSYSENALTAIDEKGNILQEYPLDSPFSEKRSAWVTQLQKAKDGSLWALLNDGQLFYRLPGEQRFQLHPATNYTYNTSNFSSFLIEDNGNIWLGGIGALWLYSNASGSCHNFDARIKELTENNCTYRQIIKDASGVIWVASDFGAIRIIRPEKLFDNYLSEGNENCSNGFCSMRGITEDDQGNIYFSYYNSIHVLDPKENNLRPLFPQNDFFNFPFGLHYYQGGLYTGNGRRIDLETLQVDTLFKQTSSDKGVVITDPDGSLWIGFGPSLYHYRPSTGLLQNYVDPQGLLNQVKDISYLHQGRDRQTIWIGTTGQGLIQLDKQKGSQAQYLPEREQHYLSSKRVIAVYESAERELWVATADGLNRISPASDSTRVYTTEDGLANNFINGLLSEGDSCMWLSTDNGLSRLSLAKDKFLNFYKEDGLSKNEFNRISFYQARNGRMYFGGLNGVNTFFPGDHFLRRRQLAKDKMLFTAFSKFDGQSDSIITQTIGLSESTPIQLNYLDKFFSFEYALANYENPTENLYSYRLEGYENEWSAPSKLNNTRYNSIPAGKYTFRVRSSSGGGKWNEQELAIPLEIGKAFYKEWWFMSLCALLALGLLYGFSQYRVYRVRAQQRELEALVKYRTRELEREKKKSDDLLLNILPAETAEELKRFGKSKARRFDSVTVMFADFRNFSQIAEQLEPEVLVEKIDQCFKGFDEIIELYGLEKIKTIGDAYMCVGGMKSTDEEGAIQIVKAALEIQAFMKALAIEKKEQQKLFFEARIGLHSGPVVGGIVGIKKFAFDIWGDTVNIAARMETQGRVGKVNISQTTYEEVCNYFDCSARGKIKVKNKGEIEMYFVEGLKAAITTPHLHNQL